MLQMKLRKEQIGINVRAHTQHSWDVWNNDTEIYKQ